MSSAAALAAPGRDHRSRQARTLFADLMGFPPDVRRRFYLDLPSRDMDAVLRIAGKEGGSMYALWADDPVGFVLDVLGENVWSKSEEILRSVPVNVRTAVPSCFSSSKCVWEHDAVQLADGRVVPARDLVDQEFTIMGWAEDGSLTPRRAWAEWNAVETVYRLTTSSGRQVVRNEQHPLWKARRTMSTRAGAQRGVVGVVPEPVGWTPLKDLAPGDMILVPDRTEVRPTGSLGRDRAALMGYLLGDGHTTREVRFTHLPGEALDDFQRIVGALGGRCYVQQTKGAALDITARGTGERRGQWLHNPIVDLVREWGLRGERARTKRFPAQAWTLPNDEMAVLLGALFACDGYASVRRLNGEATPQSIIGISLANEGLIRDVQRAMLRLGIPGGIRRSTTRVNGQPYDYWTWTISTATALRRFVEQIDVPDKRHLMRAAAETADGRRHSVLWQHRNAPDGYRWEKIKSIEPIEEPQRTVAIEVETDHAWSDLVVEHNSWTVSRLVLWKALVHPPSTVKVVTIARKWSQVRTIIWPEIRRAHAAAGLPGEVDMTQFKINDGIEHTVAWGLSANPYNEDAVQGIHAPHVLLVVDEAGGIGHTIGNNLRALLTGSDSRMVAIGNPPSDDEGSWFERFCGLDDVKVIRIPAQETPNLTGEQTGRCRSCPPEVPAHPLAEHLIQPFQVEETIADYGADSRYVKAKVNAEFPRGGPSQTIPADWVDLAVEADEPAGAGYVSLADVAPDLGVPWLVKEGAWVRVGADIAAGGGDEFVVHLAVGDLVFMVHASSGTANTNSVEVAGKLLEHVRRAEMIRKALGTTARVRVKIDAIGVGWGVSSTLQAWGAEQVHDAEVVPVVVSEDTYRADEGAIFRPYRKRDELWLAGRSLLQPRQDTGRGALRLRIDRRTKGQLSAPTYSTNSGGRTVIESKDHLKARGIGSPDRAESLLLAVYEPLLKPTGGTFKVIA